MDTDKSMTEEEILERLLDADRVPERTVGIERMGIPLTIRGLTGKTVFQIREQCTHRTNKRGQAIETLDEEQFNCRLIAAATASPKWEHPRLLEKYHASGAEEVVKRVLLAGELAALGDAVLDISGFNEELVEVKN
jgi:hypothetical protein